MNIRKTRHEDLAELLEIYNYEVLNGTATFDLHPKSMTDWEEWFSAHGKENHPLYTAELDGRAVGYASLSPYRDKEAYAATVELSVYVAHDCRGMGIASRLMQVILDDAKNDKRTHTVVSVITSGNEPSRRLHEKFGFEFCGTIDEVGKKFGRYIGIDNYRLTV